MVWNIITYWWCSLDEYKNRSMLGNLFNSIRSKDKENKCNYLSRSLAEPFFWPKELRKGDLAILRMWGNSWKEKAEEMNSLIMCMIWHKPSLHLICICTEQKKKKHSRGFANWTMMWNSIQFPEWPMIGACARQTHTQHCKALETELTVEPQTADYSVELLVWLPTDCKH